MDDESGDDDGDELTSEWGSKSIHNWRGWRNESGSCWFQRLGDAYLNKRSVIFNEEMVGREGLKRDQIVKIARFTGCKNFVGKRKKFIFNAFVNQRWEDYNTYDVQ